MTSAPKAGHRSAVRRFDSAEEWRKPPGFACLVSSLGRVRGARGVMRGWLDRDGYRRVTVPRDSDDKGSQQSVHKLVALAFIGPRPSLAYTVAHEDGARDHNAVSNLAWKTGPEQYADRVRHGTELLGAQVWNAKLTQAQAEELRRAHRPGVRGHGSRKLAARFGITKTAADRIISGAGYR